MSALKDVQDAITDLQNVTALVVDELRKPKVNESDVAALVGPIRNVSDSLRQALPIPQP